MNKKRTWITALALLFLGALAGIVLLQRNNQPAEQTGLIGLETDPGSFRRAEPGGMIPFPQVFGPQPDFQTEWWYYTGNLQTADGRHFGYQLTFFRRALQGPTEHIQRESAWAADQVYMAHFTLTDSRTGLFRYQERFSRGAAGLAGAAIEPGFQVWLENWRVEQVGENRYRLHAATQEVELQLELEDLKGPVLQGDQGYSQKSSDPGNASYYFSQTRLQSRGSLRLGGESYSVSGLSWMDREISTSVLGKGEIGWDWFALQLSDGSELMLYQIRRSDGSISPYSTGKLTRPDGSTRSLGFDEVQIEVARTWRSPHSRAVYPAAWVVSIPAEDIRLQINPTIPDQELQVSFTYWEGAVQITRSRAGQDITGVGYIEMTGYAHSMEGQL